MTTQPLSTPSDNTVGVIPSPTQESHPMKRVILESPYKGNIIQRWLNRRYARKCVKDSLSRNESPLASHLLYTQPGILNDSDAVDRYVGIEAGLNWLSQAELMVVYIDRQISNGMYAAIKRAKEMDIPIEYRRLEK